MITDSSFWKDELIERSEFIAKKMAQTRWRAASSARLEQCVMMGFYSIRKLIEAEKLSHSLSDCTVDILSWPNRKKPVDLMNWHRIDDLYELGNPKAMDLTLRFLANQIIHSFVFTPIFSPVGPPEGIAFSSDKEKEKRLYYLGLETIKSLFERAGSDYPKELHYKREAGRLVRVKIESDF